MAYRFVKEQIAERLAERSDNRHSLLLTDGEAPGGTSGAVGDADRVHHIQDFIPGFAVCQPVFQFDVFQGGQ